MLDEQGYDTIVCNVDTPEQRDHHLSALTVRHRADGVIIVSIRLAKERIAAFRRGSIPVVTVDAVAPGVPQTIIDDVAGGRLATAHLLSLGHRRIGFVGDLAGRGTEQDLGFTSSRSRLQGYRRELAAAGIGFDPELVRLGPHSAAAAADLAGQLIRAARSAHRHLRRLRHPGDGRAQRRGAVGLPGTGQAVGGGLR